MCLVCADANLGAKTVTEPVGETSGGIPEHARRIHLIQKTAGGGFVLRHDAVGVGRPVLVNVVDGFVQTGDGLHIHD